MEETKIIYYLEDQDTPYLVKLNIAPEKVTLRDFKNALNRHNYKFFFKSMDDDFGVVKEEVIDDDARLPCYNGRVISWLISTEGSIASETRSQASMNNSELVLGGGGVAVGIGQTTTATNAASPQFNSIISSIANSTELNSTAHEHIENGRAAINSIDNNMDYRKAHRLRDFNDDTNTETESMVSSMHELKLHRSSSRRHYNSFSQHLHNKRAAHKMPLHQPPVPTHHNNHYQKNGYPIEYDDTTSLMSSELDTTTFFETDNDDQYSSITESTTMSSKRYGMHRKKRLKHRIPAHSIDRASSVTSLTESTMSLNIITVTLNMDTVNFLGISIVGQSNKGGDGGIYVGSIMSGGAIAQDGRIEPGDMILQVNDISFENMSNDDAVKVLREAVMKPGPIKLVVAKCWDPNPKGYFTVSRQEPIRPIDPSAWVAHTAALTGGNVNPYGTTRGGGGGRMIPPGAASISSFGGSTSSLSQTMGGESMGFYNMRDNTNEQLNLTVNTDMETVVRAMSAPDSGLDIRDRNWLKITIQQAFIGSEVVDWLFNHVEGFPDRRDARKYACNLLKHGYIRHAVNKMRFSEQCYYVFGDSAGLLQHGAGGSLFTLNEESEDFDSVSEIDREVMGPLKTMMPPPPSYMSSSGTSSSTTSATSGIVSQTEKNYHMYYPPAPASLISGASSFIDDNHTYVTSGINSQYSAYSLSATQTQTQYNYTAAMAMSVHSHSGGSNASRHAPDRVSLKSSDNSSSGNGSDIELIAKKRHSKQKVSANSSLASFYQKSMASESMLSAAQQQPRSLDKVPADLRSSKQSFRMAMGNPCEFFVDVM